MTFSKWSKLPKLKMTPSYTFKPHEPKLLCYTVFSHAESKNKNQNSKINERLCKKVPFLANPLIIIKIKIIFNKWIISVRQFMSGDDNKENSSFRVKAMKYFGMGWNYIDIIGCLLFTIAMALRFIALATNESVFIAARFIPLNLNFF